MDENTLEILNLTKSYGKQVVLNNISFNIKKNKITGLLGPNGSGKTTIIKIINNLITNYVGSVKICDQNPGLQTKKAISYLPDKMSLPEWLKVTNAIKLFKDFYTDFNETHAKELLVTLKVPETKFISELSKGMKEKLQLVLTMSRQAKLYILDEPIAGVDPAAREVILSTIINNFSQGSSILMSTHIISDVESVFDDVIFLKDGNVKLLGNAEKLRAENNKSIDQLFRDIYGQQ